MHEWSISICWCLRSLLLICGCLWILHQIQSTDVSWLFHQCINSPSHFVVLFLHKNLR